jgi:hypothetical protein
MSLKKASLSLAAVLAIGAAGSMATFGGFVGSDNATHNFSAGKVLPTVSVTDTNGNPFNIANIVPGDTASGNINIHNAGPTAFKYETVTLSSSNPSSPLDCTILVKSTKLGIDNWGLGGAENHGAWTNSVRVPSGANETIPFSFAMPSSPTDCHGNPMSEVDNSNPLQGATQSVTFTVKAFQRDGTARTYSDSVDL